MVFKKRRHVGKHMASNRCCLRFCFLGLVILSVCSVAYIMTRGKNLNSQQFSIELLLLDQGTSLLRTCLPNGVNNLRVFCYARSDHRLDSAFGH